MKDSPSFRFVTFVMSSIAIGLVAELAFAAGQPSSAQPAEDPVLRAYLEHVDREWPGESYQQTITAESLRLLTDAIVSVAARKRLTSPTLAKSVEMLRTRTREYQRGAPDRLEQSQHLRLTLLMAADIIDGFVAAAGLEKQPVDPRLSSIRRSAESLDLTLTVRRQPDVLERFFHHAGEALRRVDRS